MITAMDRLVAASEGRPSDRIPIFCNLLDQGARELGMSLREYYSRGDFVAEAQLKLREKYGHDNVWSLFYVGKEAELLGCNDILYSDDGPPNVGEYIVKTPEDIQRLVVPDDVASHPAFRETLTCLQILRREVGGKQPICAYVTGSMSLPALLMGIEGWMELLMLGPAGARDELLRKCSDFFIKEIAAYRAAGADILVYSNPFGSTDFVPMAMFQGLSLKWMQRDLAPGGTAGVVYYCGSARMNSVIDQVIRVTGIPTYYPGPMDDVAESKRLVAGRALCAGIINDIKLIDWTPAQVRAEVRRIVEAGKPGGKFFFGTVLMPLAIPEANIRAMIEACCEFGRG